MTSSFSLPGDIPLPCSDVSVSASEVSSPLASAIPPTASPVSSITPGVTHANMYDPRAWAYYNSSCAYIAPYNQMTTAYGSPVVPASVPVTANLAPQLAAGYDPCSANAFIRAPAAVGLKDDSSSAKPAGSDDDDDTTIDRGVNRGNQKGTPLGCWGNEKSMNLNPLLLTNIQQSQYFKVTLYSLKTFTEVIDEIWYNVKHLEPWERGSRKVIVLPLGRLA